MAAPARRRARSQDPEAGLAELFAHVAQHAALYRALLGEHGSARVINHLLQRLATAVHAGRPAPGGEADPAQLPADPFATFVAGAVLGTAIDWLRRGCPGTPEHMSAAIFPHLHASAAVTSPAP